MERLRELNRAAARRWPRVFVGEDPPLESPLSEAILMLGAGELVSFAFFCGGNILAAYLVSFCTGVAVFGRLVGARRRFRRVSRES